MDKELIEQLRIQVDEIASSGHARWSNTMRDAADRLERIAAAPDAQSAEPVAVVDANDDVYWADILPDRSVKVGQPLYALPPDAAAEIARLRGLIDEQKGTIRALNMALAGEDSTSTENLVAAHEIDPGCAGLISLCMELRAERDEALLIHQTDTGTASAVEALQATIAHQAERIAELEASLEIEKGQCELREEENRTLFARTEAQAAALAKAKEALDEVQGLIEESAGVYGLHLNGDPSPWDELEAGGRFERLTTLPDALASLAQFDGAQAGEEVKPQNDAERVAE